MKTLSKTAQAILDTLADLAEQNGGYLKLDNGGSGIMPVSVEHIAPHLMAVAHYGEQNGDLMADPDMTFYRPKKGGAWIPASFQNDYMGVYQEALIFGDDGRPVQYRPRLLADLCSFTTTWMRNIKQQQHLEVTQHGKTTPENG